MKQAISNPKVFISYAWGTEEFQASVLSFARDLASDGIDVLLDKWSLKEGNDTYAYMEQCVDDPSVTNVLLLLDPLYADKADKRTGGVGAETQIISAEIYNKVRQDKFIPIVFERGEDGAIPKPHYLKGILHFDLSVAERYDSEYQRLVKRLYGIEVYEKPELGNTPKWVYDSPDIPASKRTAIQSLKKNVSYEKSRENLIQLLEDLKRRIIDYEYNSTDCLENYDSLLPFRDEYIQILLHSTGIGDALPLIGDFLQELYSGILSCSMRVDEIKQTLLHEIFIYTVIVYYKLKNYDALNYLLNRSFFGKTYARDNRQIGFCIFYNHCQAIDVAKRKRDDKHYHSGIAQHWIDNIASTVCNKKEFAFIDVLLCNYSIYGKNYGRKDWPWFPLSYVYDGEFDTLFQEFASSFKSKEIATRWAKIFGYGSLSDLVETMKVQNEVFRKNGSRRPRHESAFEPVQLFTDFIKPDEVACLI